MFQRIDRIALFIPFMFLIVGLSVYFGGFISTKSAYDQCQDQIRVNASNEGDISEACLHLLGNNQ